MILTALCAGLEAKELPGDSPPGGGGGGSFFFFVAELVPMLEREVFEPEFELFSEVIARLDCLGFASGVLLTNQLLITNRKK